MDGLARHSQRKRGANGQARPTSTALGLDSIRRNETVFRMVTLHASTVHLMQLYGSSTPSRDWRSSRVSTIARRTRLSARLSSTLA